MGEKYKQCKSCGQSRVPVEEKFCGLCGGLTDRNEEQQKKQDERHARKMEAFKE